MADTFWVPGNSAGPHINRPNKYLIHTTEGSSIEGAIAAYRQHNSWPHSTVDFRYAHTYRVCRHLEYNVAGRALRNVAGGVQTNTAGVIQIEVVGTATNPGGIDWAAIGRDVIGPTCNALGIPIQSTVAWIAYPASYGTSAAQRLSGPQWLNYRGILGHQHAPENSHGDPGAIPIQALLDAAGSGTPSTPEDDLPYTEQQLEDIVKTAVGKAMADHATVYRKEFNGLAQWVVDNTVKGVAGIEVPNFIVGDGATAPLQDMVGWGHHAGYNAAHYSGAPNFDLVGGEPAKPD